MDSQSQAAELSADWWMGQAELLQAEATRLRAVGDEAGACAADRAAHVRLTHAIAAEELS